MMSKCVICDTEFYLMCYDPPDPGELCRCGNNNNDKMEWPSDYIRRYRFKLADWIIDMVCRFVMPETLP